MTSVSDQTTGTTLFVGAACLPMVGLSFIMPLEPEVLDAILKQAGYQPTKATRDARKAAEVPDYPVSESILDVVESAPRIDTGESVSPDVDGQTSPQVNKSTIEDDPNEVDEVVVGETMDGRPITQPRVDDPDDPAPF